MRLSLIDISPYVRNTDMGEILVSADTETRRQEPGDGGSS